MVGKRLTYIDILKGFSILCIALLHFEDGVFPLWLNLWMGNFMIAAFYFSSGWLFFVKDKPISVKELCKKRWRSLGMPYLWFSLLIIVFDLLLLSVGYYDWNYILKEIYKTLTLRGIGTLWFLPALFGGEIIFVFLKNRKQKWLWGFVLATSLIYIHFYGYWTTHYRNLSIKYQLIDAPFFTLNNILKAFVLLLLGYLAHQFHHKTIEKQDLQIKYLIGTVFIALSIYFGAFVPVELDVFSLFFTPLLAPYGLSLVAEGVNQSRIGRFLEYWGKNSLVLMATHYSFVLVLFQMLNQYIYGETRLSGISSLVFFVIAILIEYLIVEVINKRFRFLLGK